MLKHRCVPLATSLPPLFAGHYRSNDPLLLLFLELSSLIKSLSTLEPYIFGRDHLMGAKQGHIQNFIVLHAWGCHFFKYCRIALLIKSETFNPSSLA